MDHNFVFGHTIEPIEISSDHSSLQDLFKIGNEAIEIPRGQSQSSDSDQTPKQKKHKKVRKHHKERKRSQSREGQKRKSNRAKNRRKDVISIHSSPEKGTVALYDSRKDSLAMARLQKCLKARMTEEDLRKDFQMNKKVREDLLSIDILSFPQPELYKYGPMDKDIPQYAKLPNFSGIIGSKLKKNKDISLDIQKKINQKSTTLHTDDISRSRYFHFSGYDQLRDNLLPDLPPIQSLHSQHFLPFAAETSTSQSWEDLQELKIQRQFNAKLNQDPNNISLWLEFVQSQEVKSGQFSSQKNRIGTFERQLNIIEKALQLNPKEPKLGHLYLDLLFRKQADPTFILQQCMTFIRAHPDNVPLWRSYIFLQLSQFHLYSHQTMLTIFQELFTLLQTIIDSTRSAIQIWKIRKAGLEVIKNMVHIFKLEGYGELATGIVTGLIDFNFFMPGDVVTIPSFQQKLLAFRKYWENHQIYKLGEIQGSTGWQNSDPPQTVKFIGNLSQKTPPHGTDLLSKQLHCQGDVWRPSHPIHDKEIIRERPQSYILFEDISFALHLYRDIDSLLLLLDILADHLEFPQIFHHQSLNSQFCSSQVKLAYTDTALANSFGSEDNYWWKRYWNPFRTTIWYSQAGTQKLEYFRRILESVLKKLPVNHRLPIYRYLVFINCCYYASEELRNRLALSQEEILKDLQELLGQSSSDLGCWCIYIFTTFQLKRNAVECVECCLQLLESDRADKKSNQMEAVYWLWIFVMSRWPQSRKNVLKIVLRMYDEVEQVSLSLDEELTGIDELRLARYFKEKILAVVEGSNPTQSEGIYLLLLFVSSVHNGFFGEMGDQVPKVVEFLLKQCRSENITQNQSYLILNNLIDTKVLTLTQFRENNLLERFPSLEVIHHWATHQVGQLPLVLAEFQEQKGRNIGFWMVYYLFLSNGPHYSLGLQDYLFTVGKQLCFQGGLNNQYPDYAILLSRLLVQDVERHSQFLRFALKQLPYAKEIYLCGLMSLGEGRERREIMSLLQQKGIRLLFSLQANE